MKKQKNEGITLIALIITIIVLILLAGVAINSLTGENSLLVRANEADDHTTTGVEKKLVELAFNAARIANQESLPVSIDQLKTELTNQGANATVSEVTEKDKFKITFSNTGNVYFVGNSNTDAGVVTSEE